MKEKLAALKSKKEEELVKIRLLEETSARVKLRSDTFYPAFEKRLLDDYLRLKGNIRVFIRVRPLLKSDARAYDSGAFAQAE